MTERKSSIIVIENPCNRNKLLVYFDPAWGFWMFPSCSMLDEDDIKGYISRELFVPQNNVYFEFEGVRSEKKYATAHKEERAYKYFIHIGQIGGLSETDFVAGGKQYRWMTPDEMLSDIDTEKGNHGLIELVREML